VKDFYTPAEAGAFNHGIALCVATLRDGAEKIPPHVNAKTAQHSAAIMRGVANLLEKLALDLDRRAPPRPESR